MIEIFKYSVIWILLSNQKTLKQYTVGYQGKIIFFYIENKWDHEKMKDMSQTKNNAWIDQHVYCIQGIFTPVLFSSSLSAGKFYDGQIPMS